MYSRKNRTNEEGTKAQWNRVRLTYCCPVFESHVHNLRMRIGFGPYLKNWTNVNVSVCTLYYIHSGNGASNFGAKEKFMRPAVEL